MLEEVMKSLLISLTAMGFALFTLSSNAQQVERADPFFADGGSYDPSIPRPETVIGHPLGHRIARTIYWLPTCEQSQICLQELLLKTLLHHEGRPILGLTITSPENHARIDEIKAAHVALSDPESAQEVSEDMPVITWLNYGVHGAEVSSLIPHGSCLSSGCCTRARDRRDIKKQRHNPYRRVQPGWQ